MSVSSSFILPFSAHFFVFFLHYLDRYFGQSLVKGFLVCFLRLSISKFWVVPSLEYFLFNAFFLRIEIV
jgi:hypothetical protein